MFSSARIYVSKASATSATVGLHRPQVQNSHDDNHEISLDSKHHCSLKSNAFLSHARNFLEKSKCFCLFIVIYRKNLMEFLRSVKYHRVRLISIAFNRPVCYFQPAMQHFMHNSKVHAQSTSKGKPNSLPLISIENHCSMFGHCSLLVLICSFAFLFYLTCVVNK